MVSAVIEATPRSAGDAGYTTDVVYPSSFGVYQAPIHLAFVAATAGRETADPAGHFQYVDLGCGAGLTLCVLADCYPEAEFHGVDISPQHVALARDLARRAGLRNIRFHEASFADLRTLPLPEAHFVGVSGVYSWVPAPLRRACLEFVGQGLAPDGACFLHYGALPGNAQLDALYAALRQTAEAFDGDSVRRFTQAVAVLRACAASGARFFKLNPLARAWLEQAHREDARGLAHEVLNAQRASLSVRDAAEELGPHGLAFVANAQPELNDLDLVAPDSLRETLRAAPRIAREMLLDVVRNAHNRMDVVMRAGGADHGERALDALLVGQLGHGDTLAQRAALAGRTHVDFGAPIFLDVLAAAEGAAGRVADLLRHPRLAGYPRADLRIAVERLATVKILTVLRQPPAPRIDAPTRLGSRLNELVLEERIEAEGPLPFASPVAGTQVLLPRADRLALLALVGGDFAAAWSRLRRGGRRVLHEGQAITDSAGLAAAARERLRRLGPQAIANLATLRVLA
jgi:SAM-dependent methyltransferase